MLKTVLCVIASVILFILIGGVHHLSSIVLSPAPKITKTFVTFELEISEVSEEFSFVLLCENIVWVLIWSIPTNSNHF